MEGNVINGVSEWKGIGSLMNFPAVFDLAKYFYHLGKQNICISSNLDEAAHNFAFFYDNGTCDGIAQDCFKAGAEWMAGQGYTSECTVYRTPLNGPAGISMNLYECDGFKLGDRVIVQIRRK